MKKFFFDCGTRDATASFGILILRVTTGLMMILGHGLPKLAKFDAMKDTFFRPDWFPMNLMSQPVSLMAVLAAEIGAAALLVLGLATRPAAFILSFAMVVAAFDMHRLDPFAEKELALVYLLIGVVIIFTGAGSYSLDSALHKESKRRRW